MPSTYARGQWAKLLLGSGVKHKTVAAILGVTSSRVSQWVYEARREHERGPGYLDTPEEFYDYERWGERTKPRWPFKPGPAPGVEHSFSQ